MPGTLKEDGNETIGDMIDLGKTIDDVLPAMENSETQCEGAFTWHISDWTNLTQDKHASPRYRIGEYEWNVLLFPRGNQNRGVSLYLEPHPEETYNEKTGELEPGDPDWSVCAQFAIGISRPGEDKKAQLFNVSHHRFCATDTDWGFANFIDLESLKYRTSSKSSGFVSDNKLNISVFVRILKDPTGVLWHNFLNYDSKKLTGYVGFKNQGATCYLNSLLQSYFFTKVFRKVVYQIPTENESPNDSVSLALQRAFYQLQKSEEPLDTLELTRSFGWDTGDAFTQHDVQELNRILMDRLENKMKGTAVEGTLNELFVGKMKSYIKCINVPYESARVEEFWDIQLNVKNLKGLKESFENYVEVEIMDGENQYAAQNFGLQDAKKGVVFEYLPPVLHLQLKRFEYDFNYDQLVKINDRYEFPESIDLAPYVDPEIEKASPDKYIYNLHCVLVHSGDISTGHYYAMIKPNLDDQWYRFDDDKVWKVLNYQAFDENFGHGRLPDEELKKMTREQYQNYLIARQTSAYMLVYIRQDMESKVLETVTDGEVPHHIVSNVERELKEREERRKELQEMHLYMTIRVHSLSNFINYQGFDLSPNERSKIYNSELHGENEYSLSLRVMKSSSLKDVKDEVVEKLGLPDTKQVNFWIMSYRKNYTLRVDSILNGELDDLPLEEAIQQMSIPRSSSVDIFIEEPYLEINYLQTLKLADQQVFPLTTQAISSLRKLARDGNLPHFEKYLRPVSEESDRILLFLKSFDVSQQRLSGFAHVLVHQDDNISLLAGQIASLTGQEKSTVSFYEEFQPDVIEKVEDDKDFILAELVDGDILTFSDNQSDGCTKFPYYESLTKYYEFLRYRIKLKLSRVDSVEEEYAVKKKEGDLESFEVWISARASYQELASLASSHLAVKPSHLKIFVVYANGRFALKWDSKIQDYLLKNFTLDSIPPLEFEVLSIPLQDLEQLRSIKFYWLNDSYIHFQSLEFRVADSCSIKEFLDRLQARVGFTDEQKAQTLLWTNSDFKFQGILTEENVFEELADSYLFFGRVLPDELSLVQQLEAATLNSEDAMDDLEDEDEEDLSIVKPQGKQKNGRLVIVIQYFRELENRHGVSFLFNLIPGENFLKTRDRLHSKFGLGSKEFSKIKLGIAVSADGGLSYKNLHGFSEEELSNVVLFDMMNNLDYICMDHPDRTRSQTYHDRPMVIKS
ncbi:LAMI_0F16468g1_1 [Lachancea mirantina]|uniref:ubiquitinyl hydrolase 1 n=1 Tax=Lachancea mirantina TaxID=1230905 RepID=A0A1G4K4Z1_9SACH|nr:LAMI_0F16468g1_1 [Lachancea mirantina]